MYFKQWEKFEKGDWQQEINVRDFIQRNYTPYEGDESFLTGATEKTKKLWDKVLELYKKEHEAEGGVLDIDTKTISTVSSHDAGYIDKDLEDIVGLQTDAPLKRAIMPFGGIRIVEQSCKAYGREVDPEVDNIFHNIRKTHNDGVFSVYTPDIRAARSNHLLTGLPDGYGRGRIIGDYRRVALYGVDALIAEKQEELEILDVDELTENVIREREEISEQIKALKELKVMAGKYGFDISEPANNAKEAVSRVQTLINMTGYDLTVSAIRELYSQAVDFIVTVKRYPDGSRKISEIVEICGMETDTVITMEPIIKFHQTGEVVDKDGRRRVVGEFKSTGGRPNADHMERFHSNGVQMLARCGCRTLRKQSKARALSSLTRFRTSSRRSLKVPASLTRLTR